MRLILILYRRENYWAGDGGDDFQISGGEDTIIFLLQSTLISPAGASESEFSTCPLEPKLLGIDQTGSGAYSFTWGLDIFKYIPPVLLYGNLFYTNFTSAMVNQTRTYYPDQITGNLAMEVLFKNSPSNKWAFLLEILSNWSAGRMIGHPVNQPPLAIINTLPVLEYLPCKWFQLAAGVQVPLFGKNTRYSYSPTLALFFNF
jgi:hypothetical protein